MSVYTATTTQRRSGITKQVNSTMTSRIYTRSMTKQPAKTAAFEQYLAMMDSNNGNPVYTIEDQRFQNWFPITKEVPIYQGSRWPGFQQTLTNTLEYPTDPASPQEKTINNSNIFSLCNEAGGQRGEKFTIRLRTISYAGSGKKYTELTCHKRFLSTELSENGKPQWKQAECYGNWTKYRVAKPNQRNAQHTSQRTALPTQPNEVPAASAPAPDVNARGQPTCPHPSFFPSVSVRQLEGRSRRNLARRNIRVSTGLSEFTIPQSRIREPINNDWRLDGTITGRRFY